jgi:cell division protein FtsW
MAGPSRADNSLLGRWWWSVDRWTLMAIFALIGLGYVMMLAASPAVAERIGEARDAFIFKQVFFLAVASAIVFALSLLSPRGVRRLSIALFGVALLMTFATLFIGPNIKGATRWISLPGFSVQPSEFLKPCFAVVTAWLLAQWQRKGGLSELGLALFLYVTIAMLLKSQPDMGMLAVITAVFLTQLFIAGLDPRLLAVGLAIALLGAVGAYAVLPHFRYRLESFLDHSKGDHYQIDRALEAFGNGGLLGRGPGEGLVKDKLPDAHADFVFAVMGEEFGLVLCTILVLIFGFIVLRGLLRLLGESDLFIVLAATGLVTSFGLQAFINMGSSIGLLPTKGMTLPFISYGGSSAMAVALGMGMLLALTRHGGSGELL